MIGIIFFIEGIAAGQEQDVAVPTACYYTERKPEEEWADLPSRLQPEAFVPQTILLEESLQQYTWEQCMAYETPLPHQEFYDLVLRVMWHESRYWKEVPDYVNNNGTVDRGLMQINSVNWQWLAELGMDVHHPEGNIEAGVFLLAELLGKYPVEYALTAYACGEAGAAQSGGESAFARRILALEPLEYLHDEELLDAPVAVETVGASSQ